MADSTSEVVVVGAGVAGCTVARRLAALGRRVLLVEAGSGIQLPDRLRRIDLSTELNHDEWVWPDVFAADGRGSGAYLQGRGLGGSGAVNAAVLAAPTRVEVDAWSTHRCDPPWGYRRLRPWIDGVVHRLGSMPVESEIGPELDLAAERLGLTMGSTSLDDNADGSIIPVLGARMVAGSIHRRSPADGIDVDGGSHSGTVELLSGVKAHYLQLSSRSVSARAVALHLTDGRSIGGDEFVLCCGAVQTPLLLLRSAMLATSGSGPGTRAGFTVLDHRSVALDFTWPDTVGDRPRRHEAALVHRIWRWRPRGSERRCGGAGREAVAHILGPFPSAHGVPLGVALVSSAQSLRRAVRTHSANGRQTITLGDCLTTAGDQDHVGESGGNPVGSVLETLADAVGEVERVLSDLGLATAGTPSTPDSASAGFAERTRWIRENPGPTYHLGASLPMSQGRRRDPAVLGAAGELGRLPGVANVTVADASVLPDLPAVGPQLTVMAVADLIAAETLAGA